MNWVKKHVAVFVSTKYKFIYFTKTFKKYDCKISLKLSKHENIKSIKVCRFLKIYLNF